VSVWKWTSWFGVGGFGVLAFLREVAQEKERVDRALARREEAAEKANRPFDARGEFVPAVSLGGVSGGNDRERSFISRQ